MIRLLCLLLILPLQAGAETGTRPWKIDGLRIPHTVFAVYRLPGDSVTLRAPVPVGKWTPTIAQGSLQAVEAGREWAWSLPETPGRYTLHLGGARANAPVLQLHAFVMHPHDTVRDGKLGNYTIGRYPSRPLRGHKVYLPPDGFVEVTPDNRNTHISPRFTLGQFVSKQAEGWPKYVVLREELLLKLELVLDRLKAHGIPGNSFHIMSGYRTPHYNKAIGNVAYSRHVYGGAADVYIDENPKDGNMDDLNGDGRVNVEDARHLVAAIEAIAREAGDAWAPGGLSAYRANPAHGPFVHMDVRGWRSRW